MPQDVYVLGVAMTHFGKHLDKSVKDLTREALDGVLADAQTDRSVIEAAFFANASQAAIEGQYMVPGQIALRAAGVGGVPVTNVENACASASTAFKLACDQIRAGEADLVLAIGAEKMLDEDKAKSFEVFNGAWDVHEAEAQVESLLRLGDGVEPPDGVAPANMKSVFMDVYAALAKHHMKTFGTTQHQIATVAAKNHQHSTLNPLAQYRQDMTVDEVLEARAISWPLTLPMCAPISDGAAAAILCSAEALSRFDATRAIRVEACVLASGRDRSAEDYDQHVCRLAATRAYARAGIGPEDISLAEVHDASAFAEILQTENLGFCQIGGGGALAESGATTLGGRLPVNVSGGLESKGHPIGATGLGQIYELVMQLRGETGERQVEGARFAIAENGGGFRGCEEAAACITILGRADWSRA